MFKRALISVSDKSGLVDFLRPLVESGLHIVSSGGTAKFLKENDFVVEDVSHLTGFPEVFDGRVKTLHPKVHAPILARWDLPSDMATLGDMEIEPFDLVIVNLYPFEKKLVEGFKDDAEMIEMIDIGGPSLLRGAAKNHKFVTVLCDPADYDWIRQKKNLTVQDRQRLATKVFYHTSVYDSVVARTLEKSFGSSESNLLFTAGGNLHRKLRYGENPQQTGRWFRDPFQPHGWHSAKIVQGKELSFNNLLDLDAAEGALREIQQKFACVVVKHNNPCGIAFGGTGLEAVERAIAADPVSAFGGIVAVNFELTEPIAQKLNTVFLECVVAPKIQNEAKPVLAKKENLRVLEISGDHLPAQALSVKTISGGYLVQDSDQVDPHFQKSWQILSEPRMSMQDIPLGVRDDLLLAWIAVAHLKSNAIAIVKGGQSVGLGMGQVNRVDAVKQAIARMRSLHTECSGAVLASDAFFPFSDSIKVIAEAGIKWVMQPGGSKKDAEVISVARDLGVNIVLTGKRHFRH